MRQSEVPTLDDYFCIPFGVSSIGEFIYLVTINVFVLDKTHSASAVAGLWVVSRVASLLIAILPLFSHIYPIYGIPFLLGVCTPLFGNVFLPYRTMLIPPEHRKP
jgi:hypothetical protein